MAGRTHFTATAFVAIISLCVVAVAAQDRGRRCCTAEQYEMEVGLSTANFGADHYFLTGVMPRISVDVTNKRVALNEWLYDSGRIVQNLTTVADYREQIAYVVTWADARGTPASCNKVKLPQQMLNHCIPRDAQYSGSGKLGADSSPLVYDAWTVYSPGAAIYTTVQRGTCVVVSESVFAGTKEGLQTFTGMMYSNFSPGFRDRSVFDVPKFCRSAVVVDRERFTDTARHVVDRFMKRGE